jgi:serine/threonine protein kinase
MILEFMHGDLMSSQISLDDVPQILVDILIGLRDLHSKKFVHFDIRPGKHN